MKTALITGINGQDGSYLSEFLLKKGYCVHGIIRRKSDENFTNINLIEEKSKTNNLYLHYSDLIDSNSILNIIKKVMPEEIYNLAAQSHVGVSFEIPEYTAEVNALGIIRILEAVRSVCPNAKVYQASSSEMFGNTHKNIALNEEDYFNPKSPYGCSKVFAHNIVTNYRKAYQTFAVCGILFNHESPRRGKQFVTRKISYCLSKIKLGILDKFSLGNLEAKRDWGYAKEYVEAMWLMLQQPDPQDFVIATGETHSVREFVELSCKILNIKLEWKGSGANEIGIDKSTGKTIIDINPYLYRPEEINYLLGNYEKVKNILGWQPKIKFNELVEMMCKEDYRQLISQNYFSKIKSSNTKVSTFEE